MQTTRQITLDNGAQITVTAHAQLIARTVNNDWERITVGQDLTEGYEIKAELNGKTVEARAQMTWIDQSADRNADRVAQGQVAILGKTVGLRQAAAEQIQAAIDEAVAETQTAEIVEYKRADRAAFSRHLDDTIAHEDHVRRIESID